MLDKTEQSILMDLFEMSFGKNEIKGIKTVEYISVVMNGETDDCPYSNIVVYLTYLSNADDKSSDKKYLALNIIIDNMADCEGIEKIMSINKNQVSQNTSEKSEIYVYDYVINIDYYKNEDIVDVIMSFVLILPYKVLKS
jgi:hypothetical protein